MILVTGATGFLGKRVCRQLTELGLVFSPTSLTLGTDLRDSHATQALFDRVKPVQVINCAAYVGGIQFGYKHSAELFHNNLLMTLNLLASAKSVEVKRIVNPISNCAYPANATLFKEAEFWDGPLHESVLVYGFVRKASWIGSWAYQKQYGLDVLNLILSNMYGPEDHFDEERSHALGALIMKMVRAKNLNQPEVTVWGSGKPVREWLHVDDGAEAVIRGLAAPTTLDPVNIGVAQGISILEMAEEIKKSVGYKGALVLDTSKPDGAPYKTVDGSKGAELLGWKPSRSLAKVFKTLLTGTYKMAITEIKDGDLVLARHVPEAEAWGQGLKFFSPNGDYEQVGTWGYDQGKILLAHTHNEVARTVLWTQEVLYIRKGKIKAQIFDTREVLVAELVVADGDLLILLRGGHGYEILEDGTQVLEIKNGPYVGADADRRRL